MPSIRPAAVAGTFYPGRPADLAAEIAAYLAQADVADGGAAPKAVIAPHAGYVYSGPVAASVYARLRPLAGLITRVVLAGPAHRVYVRGIALPEAETFATPLGPIPLDGAAMAALRALAFVVTSGRAHALEHSLEVHRPFLKTVLGDVALVPLAVGDATPEEMAMALETVWGGPETLIVVSSDLSHFHSYEVARALDGATAESILRLDPSVDTEAACGAAPINGLLTIARRRGLACELVDLRNSGDTAGDKDRVVGYGAFAFHGHEPA